MTSAPGSRTQVMDPRTGALPRLLWSPDDTDPGWFHTAEWELAEDWDAPATAEWAQQPQVIDITDAALAAEQAAHGALTPFEPQAVPVPEWLAAPADTLAGLATGPLVVDPVPATVSLPKPLPRRRDLRSTTTAGAHHTLPARRELHEIPAETGVPVLDAPARPVAADDTQVLPRRRDLRRGRQLLVLPTAAVAALPPTAGDLAVEGDGLAAPAVVAEGRRHRESPTPKPSTLTTTVARAGVVSVLVAVGIATIGGNHAGFGTGTNVGDVAGNASLPEAGQALRSAPLPGVPLSLWGPQSSAGALPPKFARDTTSVAAGGNGDARNVLGSALNDLKAAQARAKAAEQAKKNHETPPAADRSTPISATGVKGIARAMMLSEYGWGDTQFRCLNSLWTRESGWNYRAYNRHSGATGIPQALPGSKMRSAGADWRTNPATQIEWGLDYIHDRYGTPCGAWSHSQNHGYY